jgi:hypothetical protein
LSKKKIKERDSDIENISGILKVYPLQNPIELMLTDDLTRLVTGGKI